MTRRLSAIVLCTTLLLGVNAVAQDDANPSKSANPADKAPAEPDQAAVERVGEDIRYLASDELEGRGPQTQGLELAAQHLESRFKSLGLRGGGEGDSFRDTFDIPVDTKVLKDEVKFIITPASGEPIELKMGKDFQPLAAGGNGAVESEMVFVGYGISAPKLKYEEYAGVDVEGKVVVLIRREPQQDDEESVFNGKATSTHALIQTKIQAAKKAKAAAIVMVNDPHSTEGKTDALTPPNGFGSRGSGIPYIHLSQQRLNELLAITPVMAGDKPLKTVAEISEYIDAELKPVSAPMLCKADLKCAFQSVKATVANVIGVLDGEGPLADETIVVGAHYDHLGFGPFGSRKPKERAIHNGADDNATGTAAVLELARRFATAEKKPTRRMVFIGFTAEERGILGSNHYLQKPAISIDKTVAMINFDMIGMYGKQGVTVGGLGSAREFGNALEQVNQTLELKVKRSNSVGGSDHAGFYRKGVPVLFFHTGLTDLYHTPEDDFETIDVGGAVLTIDLAEAMLREVLKMDKAPEYVKVQPRARRAVVYLGVVPAFQAGVSGALLNAVDDDSPAKRAGLMAKDVIIKLDDTSIKNFQQLVGKLRKYKVNDEVAVVIRRGDEEMTMKVKLAGPPK